MSQKMLLDQKVEVEIGANSQGRIEVDGVDVANIVKSMTIRTEPGRIPTIELVCIAPSLAAKFASANVLAVFDAEPDAVTFV